MRIAAICRWQVQAMVPSLLQVAGRTTHPYTRPPGTVGTFAGSSLLDRNVGTFFKPGDGHAPHRVEIIDGGLKAYVFAEFAGMNVSGSACGD
jgi:hypothetical protein